MRVPTALAVLILAMGTLATAAPAPAAASPSALMRVHLDRRQYSDGVHRAEFNVEGACVANAPPVNVESSDCGSGEPKARGSISSAILGFNAIHTVDVGRDAPRTNTEHRLPLEQHNLVRVEVPADGRIQVRLSAPALGSAKPEIVRDSVSPGGAVEDQTVVWDLDAPAGTYEFSVRLRFPGETDPTAGYLPQVDVMRMALSAHPLASAEGPAGDPVETHRTTHLTLRPRAYGGSIPPVISDGKLYGAVDAHGLTQAFGGQVAFDAPTDYWAGQQGHVSRSFSTSPGHLVPSAGDALNSQLRAFTAATDSKVELILDGDNTVGLRTARPLTTSPTPSVDPAAGMIYAGDSVHAGVGTALLSTAALEDRAPVNNSGEMELDWLGGTARAWSTTVANQAPAGEPNASNPAEAYRVGPLGDLYGSRATLQTIYAVPITVAAGDIDNRDGAVGVTGPAITLTAPTGYSVTRVVIAATAPSAANVTFGRQTHSTDTGLGLTAVTLRPTIAPGGYWLESSRDGYFRDWAGGVKAVVFSSPSGQLATTAQVDAYEIRVAPGYTTAVDLFDTKGWVDRVMLTTPGVYRTGLDRTGRLTAKRVGPLTGR
jgi:hypothetical protein